MDEPRERVEVLPPGFSAVASTGNAPLAAMADESRRYYGLPFHPEVTHTRQGLQTLERSVREACGCDALWDAGHIIADSVSRIREQVGHGRVLLGLSGGVDSSVVAASYTARSASSWCACSWTTACCGSARATRSWTSLRSTWACG